MENRESPLPEGQVIGRRTIVRGVAWSIPVIAAAVAVPSATASVGCVPQTVTVVPNGRDQGQQTVTIPPTATNVTFTVRGGAGGGPQTGGAAAVVTGTLSLAGFTEPLVLDLIAGAQGHPRGHSLPAQGYGDGGVGSADNQIQGTGGGAGSAILLGGLPLVVAGGGGGAASTVSVGGAPAGGTGVGGSGGSVVGNGTGSAYATGGRGGDGTVPGAGGVATVPSGVRDTVANNGAPGTSSSGTTGGNGGSTSSLGVGGGGGGYAGGGSGAYARWTTPANQLVLHMSGGGAGSSYVAPHPLVATSTITTGGIPDSPFLTQQGVVTVSWTC